MVKTYVAPSCLRMVGKAWQIRALLRTFANSQITLEEYLRMQTQQSR